MSPICSHLGGSPIALHDLHATSSEAHYMNRELPVDLSYSPPMAILSLRDIIFLSFCGLLHIIYRNQRRSHLSLPPSLPRWPLIGNAFQIPLTYAHIYYQELERKLGSKIMYLEAFGRSIIVINDAQIAKELLEKRSALYSSRPRITMLHDVVGDTDHFSMMPYGEKWRSHRRLFQQHFSPKTLSRDQERTMEFVRKALMSNLYQDSRHVHDHVRGCMGGLSLSLTYGLPVLRNHDPLVQLSQETFSAAAGSVAPGRFLVNVVPMLKYVPEWVPGATFKTVGRQIREQLTLLREGSYMDTLKRMDGGTAPASFVSTSLEKCRNAPDYEHQALHIKQTAMQIFGAASETSVAATMTFVLAMLNYPDIQRKAQEEVDSVVGPDRLPDFSDRPRLPYLLAIIKEVLRWNPIVPMSLPHMTTEEDVYEGYYIPKGCTIMSNTYAILHDEEIFPNPKEFNPSRFIEDGILLDDTLDPAVIATFGFGRRICPGAHIGLSALYLTCVSILSLFDISPALDADGKPIEAVPEFFAASLVSEPLPFECKFTPRKGKDVEGLLQDYLGTDVIS
ncbi:cytochrome P450 [Macrolepiota fuliginosa MF-IS2]|uniref:Cytochrome P450 n=1 Tax=Macrolepiota fuliginosa MF-IS2 TaxID=1400762 RepID=A0A9P6C6S3_9AGAR|nr:cytochrome P450 [Macrolepiota fuliginosa MF-IS2]